MLDKAFLLVINMSYIGGIVILFILAARMLLKKAPKKYSYILWAIVLFRLLIPISIESSLSLLPMDSSTISKDILFSSGSQINTGISNIDQLIVTSIPGTDVTASVDPIQIWIRIGGIIWIIGIGLLLIYGIRLLIKMKRKLEDSSLYKDNIWTTENIDTPFVLGLLEPKIYLPASLIESEKEYIVLHEQTHIKRFDHVIRFITYLVLCVHWFNPLVWIAVWKSGEDMEMSCDESVISQLGQNVKKNYSQSLLNLTTGRKNFPITPLAFGEGETKGRIKNIINFKQPRFYIIAIALIVLIVAFVGLTTNPKKDSKYYAEEFLQTFTNPEDAEFTKYYDPIFDSESATESQNNFENYLALIEREYRDLMTNEAFDHAMSNRFIPFEALIKEDTHYNIEVDSVDLKEARIYEDGRVHYIYLLSLRVLFSNGDAEEVSVSGDIVMIEENGFWLVDVFKWNSDYQDLYKLLLTNLVTEEVKEYTSTFTKEEIDSAINIVKENFDFSDSTITEIWYDKERSETMTKDYLEMGRGSINGVKSENVIVLLSEFEVGDEGGSGLEPNTTYKNWRWILIRDSARESWEIDDWGY